MMDININKIRNTLCVFMGVCIFLLSFAHASLNSDLYITGEAVVRAETGIRIIDSERDVVTNGAYEVYNSRYTVNTTSHFIALPNCDSTITYKVTIQNNTSDTYWLKDISILSTTNDNIEYSVDNIEISNNKILNNTTMDVLITFKYKVCPETKEDVNITLHYLIVKAKGYLKANARNIGPTNKFLGTDLINNQINTISFVGYKDIPEDALGSYDVTDPNKINDGDNVNLWYYKAEGYTDAVPLYDVYIGTNGEIHIINGEVLFGYLENLKQINFKDENGINRFNTSETINMGSMFGNAKSLENIDLSGFNTSNVTNMAAIFKDCSSLTTLDVSSFDTSNVVHFAEMFAGLTNITELDLSSLDTSKAKYMFSMFSNSTSLASLDLSNFNTSNAIDMQRMFEGCSSLMNVNLSSFNTSKVTDMSGMFDGCASLANIDLSNFNTSSLEQMASMFNGCTSLTTLDLSNFNTSKVTNMTAVFYECTALKTLDLSNFNTSKVTSMQNMFYKCSSLTDLDISNFNTSKVLNMASMFCGCASLENLDLSNFNTSNVTTMIYMFASMSKVKSINLSSFDTSKVTKMSNMFNGCSELLSLDLSNFNTINVTDMSCMFRYLNKIETLTLGPNFNTSKITDMAYMFQGLKNIIELDLSGFDTSNVTSMKSMFYNCSKLKTIYASDSFVTTKVTNSGGMFLYSPNIVGGAGTTYNGSYLDKTYARIDEGETNPGYFTRKTN